MDVLGRDSVREGYRVAISDAGARVVGLIPDAVISTSMNLTGGHGHQTAYDWLARHQDQIETTLRGLASGTGRIRAPFDRVVLEKDA
ncbi:MAG: hypothetical protein AAFV31_01115 [Pseudomonadota bacterium]